MLKACIWFYCTCIVFRTDVIFSPDDQLIITGTSVDRGEGYGSIVFLDRQSLERIDEIPVVQGEVSWKLFCWKRYGTDLRHLLVFQSVVRVIWHPKLNQIVTGCGDGQARLYYDPNKSSRSVNCYWTGVYFLAMQLPKIFFSILQWSDVECCEATQS